jgi:hypothetical protein
MANVVISEEIATMWQSYQRLCSVWHTLANPEGEINDSILDVIAKDPKVGRSAASLAMFGNYLKFMLNSQKDGVVLPPTPETFSDWYNGKKHNIT